MTDFLSEVDRHILERIAPEIPSMITSPAIRSSVLKKLPLVTQMLNTGQVAGG